MQLVKAEDIPKGQPFDVKDVKGAEELHDKLIMAMMQHRGAVGLSAVQFGIPYQCFIIRYLDSGLVFFNTTYVGYGDKIEDEEGCLSLPGEIYLVKRFPRISVHGLLYSEKTKGLKRIEKIYDKKRVFYDDMTARIIQHEADHQDGILIRDIGEKVVPVSKASAFKKLFGDAIPSDAPLETVNIGGNNDSYS